MDLDPTLEERVKEHGVLFASLVSLIEELYKRIEKLEKRLRQIEHD